MSTLYLMRHGQTYFNVWHKVQGVTDSPLTEAGINQAKEVGKYFKEHNINFDEAYSSTSERACDTLEYVTGFTQHQYDRMKELKEWNFGSFEAQDERLNPPVPYGDFFVKYGGEDQKEVGQRMYTAIYKIMSKAKQNENVLIVSHAGAIFNFFRAANFDLKEIRKIKFTNCSVAKIEFKDNKFKYLTTLNPALSS